MTASGRNRRTLGPATDLLDRGVQVRIYREVTPRRCAGGRTEPAIA